MKKPFRISSTLLALSILCSPPSLQAAEPEVTTADNLLARIQVEDFMHAYYWELASGEFGSIGDFWTPDAVFDVNGEILDGIPAIEGAYAGGLGPGGRLVFQMDIPQIRIAGNRATVDLVYTGVLNMDRNKAPVLYEQGHDHAELVRSGDSWKIEKRVLRSFSLDASYEE